MKKKAITLVLCAAMVATVFAGCGKSAKKEAPKASADATEAEAGKIPDDYVYYFPLDEKSDDVKHAVPDTAAGKINTDDDEIKYIPGVKGNAAYTDGVSGIKLNGNGTDSTTYTVSYWLYATRFSNFMPTLQFGPDVHGDATGGQHYINITRTEWNKEGATFPCTWSYDQAADGSPWPAWYPEEVNEHLKEWMNITLTVDEADKSADGTTATAHLYLNGKELVSHDDDGNELRPQVTFGCMKKSDNFDYLLGVNYWDSCFKGAFDEVYVYDRVLKPAEIEALYKAGDPSVKFEEPEHEFNVVENKDAKEKIGKTDLSMDFWSDFSSGIELKDGETKEITLKNYSDGAQPYDNYVLAFTNDKTKAHQDPNKTGNKNHKEYAVLRADAYAWIGDKNSGDEANKDIFDIKAGWGNWETWQNQVMKDADVTLDVTRKGDKITVNANDVDYNGTSNTMDATIKVDMKKSDPCYLAITGEKCYIEINSVSTKSSVKVDKNAIDHVGNTDLTGAFWSDWSKGYEIKDGETKTMKITNFSNVENNWENFVLGFDGAETEAHKAPADQLGDKYKEYAVFRADAYAWMGDVNSGADTKNFKMTTSWGDDWDSWKNMVKDCTVTITIKRTGGQIDLTYDFVGADGTKMNETCMAKTAAKASDPMFFFLTNEKAYNDILSVE